MKTGERLLGAGELCGYARRVWAMRDRPGFRRTDEDYVRALELWGRSVKALGLVPRGGGAGGDRQTA